MDDSECVLRRVLRRDIAGECIPGIVRRLFLSPDIGDVTGLTGLTAGSGCLSPTIVRPDGLTVLRMVGVCGVVAARGVDGSGICCVRGSTEYAAL